MDASVWIGDWSETAQVLLQLDAVISVDTGLAHLAGLMGGADDCHFAEGFGLALAPR